MEGHRRYEFDGSFCKGCWNIMGIIPDCDHARVIGCFRGPEDIPFLRDTNGKLVVYLDAVTP